jgi:ABC-type transport system involved in cytochrome bd biosynthesis fused ATPase/permease subunit
MFKDDQQASLCCRALLRRVRLEHLWEEDGPTKRAVEMIEQGSPLSSGEDLMLRIAFDLWNARGNATVGRVCAVLDDDHTEAVCSLLIARARGGQAIVNWLARYDVPPVSTRRIS